MNINRCSICLRLVKANVNKFRNYHSEHVFGFKRKTRKAFQVPDEVYAARCKESNFYRLVTAYKQHGHKCSNIDPVAFTQNASSVVPELDLKRYGLSINNEVTFTGIVNVGKHRGTVSYAEEQLRNIYCQHIATEFSHLEDEEEIEWLSQEIEKLPRQAIDNDTKLQILTDLLKSECFDQFLGIKFGSLKRYGAEGAEGMFPFFTNFFRLAAEDNIEQIVLAMPHRGRLNLLTGILNFSPARMFSKIKGNSDFPDKYKASGDVLSHLIASTDLKYGDKTVHLSLLYNPSHLEAVNPVSMGKTRAKQMITGDGDYGQSNEWSDKVINLQVHGDAAIAGQGINQECLMLSRVPHFEVGGSVHLVVNNQVGFTTPAARGRSSRYCTDVARIISAPVIHVNGDLPEEVLKVSKVAFEYQRKFRKDIFVDINCYRLWGHNELDDPTFTNPALYNVIRSKKTVPQMYADKLINEGIVSEDICKNTVESHRAWLNDELKAAETYKPEDLHFKNNWDGYSQAEDAVTTWDTGVDTDLLTFVGSKSVQYPNDFNIHPTLLRTHIKNRLSKVSEGENVDWSTAEALAMGSLLFQGYNVRISGQDVGRGTFCHRHVMMVDQKSNSTYVPLNHMHKDQNGFLEVANSILSEEAVLGYEYGYSVESPRNLVMWEAQFGDFFNGAQVIFDTFITSGEEKWLWQSGLTVLLPHGYDGAGPEHSSSRIERFLQLTDSKETKPDGDNVNMQVCQPSTPAQYFHLLRRQMVRNFRKPLIIITPKTLLRHPKCTSNFMEMTPGTHFKPVIGDSSVEPSKVKKVLLTSGKHYYSLAEKRENLKTNDTALIRVESFSPFPTIELQTELSKYPNATKVLWCQEEPRNMGAWTFFKPRFENLVGKKISYVGRETSAAPAIGVGKIHQQEAEEVTTKPFFN
ncbi:unnamed protein product [Acanthoscelides obtectus]|uniref:Transketolase-like pyrimidine-binding domain-containing protein n=1 Tax=Acanthoscelides obtectus TaxID=200917 RepID=A0A9P0PTP6_ACAOB|nr:unnamed protein product [Acanthoscelides obtectus]CAK1658782.1 Probable 2-oxoglutarate dehydrogenase E1 component DHKTD1 homolog, mitochondrial [Acanthoscelides obtectus]